jgi:hypothetical protein
VLSGFDAQVEIVQNSFCSADNLNVAHLEERT